jgi:radical SAM superfamily enzyme YgiQ (UPF0313 family)
MKVHLIQPPYGGTEIDVQPPLGLLALAAQLEKEEHEVRIVDLNLMVKTGQIVPRKSLRTQFVKTIPKNKKHVDLIGVSTWSYNFGITMEFVDAIKRKHPDVPIVLGGPHVTFLDQRVMERFPQVDYVMRDECDHTFPQLLRALTFKNPPEKLALIPGLTWRRGGELVSNPRGSVVEDLDSLPYPALHLIDVRDYLPSSPVLAIEAGRGCPFNCNFCSTTNMFQRKYRAKSPPRLLDEVAWTMKTCGHKRFELLHDNLVAGKKYVTALCGEIRERNMDFDWSCTSRTDNLTEEIAQQMFLAGCVSIFFGIESMSAARQQWTGKRLKPERVEEVIRFTRRQHMTPSVGIIVGFPDESHEELDATVAAAFRWTTDPAIRAELSTATLRYYPGADLWANQDQLRYDPLAAVDARFLKDFELREEWREDVDLFPLDAIHTDEAETTRNLLHRNFVRTLLKAAPHTFAACMRLLKLEPHELFEKMAVGREFPSLHRPDRLALWNDILSALAAVVDEADCEITREVLTCEVPFWTSTPAIPDQKTLEHVVHPKRYEQESLLAYVLGRREEPPLEVAEETSIVAIRCGLENVVWFTPQPQQVVETFERHYAQDPEGTIAFVNGLRRGL